MKTIILGIISICTCLCVRSQIVNPQIRAGFGIDAGVRTNYFNGSAGTSDDDWFTNGTPGSGNFMIDTTGAAAVLANYISNPLSKRGTFYRDMVYPEFSVVNNRLLVDALFIRDHHGTDSSAFLSSNKNGQSPATWQATGASQGSAATPVLNKNDIEDVFFHVRRDGPTLSDSLYFMGGLSLLGTTGNRYFDFEFYQTDMYFDQNTGKFVNYGPDAGHTSWEFDAAGNILKSGDVIFTAEFSSSGLTDLQARIWIKGADTVINPTRFNWDQKLKWYYGDGGSNTTYGYAAIKPKNGLTYYSGLQCDNNTWAGPFGFIDPNDNVASDYSARNFMEVSINMTALGLDPYSIMGGNDCGAGFRRVFAKTRTSTSFDSNLSDFVGPYAFATPPGVNIAATLGEECGGFGISGVFVTNPLSTSTYTWTTPDGIIVTSPAVGTSIDVDGAGTYIVHQQLYAGCNIYATDTVALSVQAGCLFVLASESLHFSAELNRSTSYLKWKYDNEDAVSYELERSLDGRTFRKISTVNANAEFNAQNEYLYQDDVSGLKSAVIFYRLAVIKNGESTKTYSKVVSVKNVQSKVVSVYPNPAKDRITISGNISNDNLSAQLFDVYGRSVKLYSQVSSDMQLNVSGLPKGIYILNLHNGKELVSTVKVVKE